MNLATERNNSAARPPVTRPVVRAALRSAAHSDLNRRRARDLVWGWVGAKWPRLMPSASELEWSHIERTAPGRKLSVATHADGSAWTLEVTYSERDGGSWTTRALVADGGDADVMAVQTSCRDLPSPPAVVAPPKLLGTWVERLALEDGGVPVLGEPRMVSDEEQLAAFCDHLLSAHRTLPVIALTHKPQSRYYGVDPRGLAQVVRGLAHVACLTPELATGVGQRLGRPLAPVPGIARIYGRGFSADAAPADHPSVRPPVHQDASREEDPGALRRLICRRICAMSVNATTGYESLLAPQ
jgi:hypothetical protein